MVSPWNIEYKYTKVLPQTFVNVQDLNSIKAFYDCELNYDEEYRGTKLDLQEIGNFGSNNNWWYSDNYYNCFTFIFGLKKNTNQIYLASK